MLTDTRRNNETCRTSFLIVLSSEMEHVTLYFLIYIYIYYFLKNISVTCVSCTILLKDLQKHGCDVRCDLSCYMCDMLTFRCKGIFWRKKHLELRITQISESGFSFSQASYCILLLVKL